MATVKENESLNIGMERLIMGMTGQLCEEEDHKIVEDLRGNVFGPLEFSRRDLMAINIQRARDHGLPDYNTVRELFNLSRITDVSEFIHVSPEVSKYVCLCWKGECKVSLFSFKYPFFRSRRK